MAADPLISAIERHEALAEQYGNLSEDRSKALDYYLGEPLGNEVDGRSQVVSRDVFDTVEWLKPQLADIFCGGDEIINFTPRGPEDVQAAEQESEFVNYIITQKNDWFTTFYGWMHDALLQKVGYVKAYWDDAEDRTKEKYDDLTQDELVALMANNPDVEIVELKEESEEGETKYTVTLRRSSEYGCARYFGVPPEHIYVDHNALGLSLQDPRVSFVEQREYKTISQLRDEGYDVPDDIQDGGDNRDDWEEDLRDKNQPFRNKEGDESDPSMRRVKVRECWIRFDRDEDGRAELLHVVVVGTTILDEEEAEFVPIVALSPVPLPHQHHGLSLADAVMDLQLIKTALLRGSLDNIYLANNGRHVIDEDAINLDDMLVSRPGGVVRKKAGVPMSDAIMPLTHSTTGDVAVPMMEYVDRIGAKRTGVSEAQQGLDPNALNNNAGAHANSAMITAAMQRIKFIARIFAETGVKNLFQIIHALTLKHSRKAEIVRIRNQWVPVDPRQWVKRSDMQISVGLGAGDKQQQVMVLNQILQMQTMALQAGLTSPVKIFNALKRFTQAAGFKDANEFWDDPSTKPPMPPQPNPEVLKEQAKIQGQMQIEMGKANTQLAIAREQNALKMQELQAQLQLQAANDARDAERERMKAEYEAQVEAMRLQLQQWQTEFTQQMAQLMNSTDNATRLQIAEMQTATQVRAQDSSMAQAKDQADREDKRMGTDIKAEAAKQSESQMSGVTKLLQQIQKAQEMAAQPKETPKVTKIERVRDGAGKLVGAKRHYSDGTVEEIPIQ